MGEYYGAALNCLHCAIKIIILCNLLKLLCAIIIIKYLSLSDHFKLLLIMEIGILMLCVNSLFVQMSLFCYHFNLDMTL